MTRESNAWVLVLPEPQDQRPRDATEGTARRRRFFPDHDLARALGAARSLAPDDRIVTTLCASAVDLEMAEAVPGFVLDLPGSFGTAAGALLATARIHRRDPGATIVTLSPGAAKRISARSLRGALRPALDWTHRMPNHALVLLDRSPADGNRDWIVPTGTTRPGLPVRIEDLRVQVPTEAEGALRDRGALPSLGLVVVAARTLRAIFQTVEPVLYQALRPVFAEIESFRGARLDDGTREIVERVAAGMHPESAQSSLRDVLRRSLPWLMACPVESGGEPWTMDSGRSSQAAGRSSRSLEISAGRPPRSRAESTPR